VNTAEIAIEQVLAGTLALIALVLPFVVPGRVLSLMESGPIAVLVVGASYVLGAMFDRLLDSVLGGAEHWNRLEAEARERERPHRDGPEARPFGQDTLEATLRGESGGPEWAGYLKTRIRILRSLGLLAPLVGLSVWITVLWAGGATERPHSDLGRHWTGLGDLFMAVSPLALCVFAFLVSRVPPELPTTEQWDFEKKGPKKPLTAALPRTPGWSWPWTVLLLPLLFEALLDLILYLFRVLRWSSRKTHGAGKAGTSKAHEEEESARHLPSPGTYSWELFAWRPVISMYVAVAIVVLMGIVVGGDNAMELSYIPALGLMVGALALWCWGRVFRTYLRFLARFWEVSGDGGVPKKR
jgi:hypothetical protein